MTMFRPISAYAALAPEERAACDALVREMESIATQAGQPLGILLSKGFDVPQSVTARDTKGMMQRDRVKNAVWERLNDLARDNDLTEYRWFKEVRTLAMSSVGDFLRHDDEGNPYFSLEDATPEQLATIKALEIEKPRAGNEDIFGERPTKVKIKITLHPKLDALKMLGEYAGYLSTDAPQGRADRRTETPDTVLTPENAADEYQKMLEGGA